MSARLDEFRVLVDALREARRLSPREAEHRPLLDKIALLVDGMDDDEREIANSEGWRGWPDPHDARMKRQVENTDPDDASRGGDRPRTVSEDLLCRIRQRGFRKEERSRLLRALLGGKADEVAKQREELLAAVLKAAANLKQEIA